MIRRTVKGRARNATWSDSREYLAKCECPENGLLSNDDNATMAGTWVQSIIDGVGSLYAMVCGCSEYDMPYEEGAELVLWLIDSDDGSEEVDDINFRAVISPSNREVLEPKNIRAGRKKQPLYKLTAIQKYAVMNNEQVCARTVRLEVSMRAKLNSRFVWEADPVMDVILGYVVVKYHEMLDSCFAGQICRWDTLKYKGARQSLHEDAFLF